VRLALRPVYLAGREGLLAELDAQLAAGEESGLRLVALVGLGGAGKSSVALEYAYRHLAEVGVAWQFPAEDATVLAAGFGELAAQLGARDMLDVRDPVASVHGVLAASPAQWLLVFDNAPDRASVAAFVPPAGRGRVLITSRNQIWPPGQALEVPVLNPEVAAEFLVSRTGDADGQAAPDLARELGGLPLALEQAAAYVQATGENLADYLALFRQQRVGMLGRGEPTGYSETVATTWRLAFERLQQAEPGAVGLLRLLAFCAPEAIPLRLLHPSPGLGDELGPGIAPVLVPLLEDPLAAKDAIVALRRHSLISPPADGSVSVHRLVQAITIAQMPAELAAAWQQAAAAVIEAALPADPESPDTWDAFAELLPHAQAVLADDSGSMWKIVSYLGNSGNYPAARDLQQRLLQAQVRVSGPEHPDTLTARGDLAYWNGQAGDPAGARDQVAALLPVRERVLGPEHPDTLADRANLARFTGDAGDAAGARDLYAALLPVRERVLGPEDPSTLRARHGLARWTGEAGDTAGARHQFAVLLPVRERVSGPEHPDTLTARGDLVYWTGQAGDAAGARDQYAALLPVRERVLGPEHPETLTDRHELARWTGEAGDAAGACDQFAALLPVRERVSGPEHPDTLTTRRHLAHWTAMAGDAAAARDQLAALLPIEERVLGDEYPQTLADRGGLAIWTGAAGDAAGARDQYAVLLPTQKRVMGAEHPYTLAARARLAYWTGAAGDAAGARDQYAALLPILKRVLGDEHPETLIDRSNLANWTGEAGDPARARDQLAALMPARERVSGAEHPDTLTDHARLARWTGAAGDAAGARDQYAALLPARDRVLGTGHPETQAARETLANWADEADDDVSRG
jgi:Tetratricopeptide repeat